MSASATPSVRAGTEPESALPTVAMLLGGRYRLWERLAEQDGAAEWRATDEVLARPVAVWTFPPESRRAGEVIAAARAAARVSDARLARVLDADERAEPPYIVTEWPSGTRPARHGSAALPSATAGRLVPVSASAFGPRGVSDGDNPQLATFAVHGGGHAAWHTDWYTTARFGNLKPGTGLLLDMGRPVTITGAQVTLGGIPGADLELRVGATPTLADLLPVADATNAYGVVRLALARPARGRYVLIWFTRLPPDSFGSFQVTVSNLTLR